MRPTALTLRGFRSFADLSLQLPQGCVSLAGPNGSGKSSLVDALDVALFGPDGRSWDPYLRAGDTSLLVELEIEHGGYLYRVRRSFNGKRATLDLEHAVPGYDEDDLRRGIDLAQQGIEPRPFHDVWEPLTQGTVADTQAHLERILGLSRETLRASAILRQGDGGAFCEAAPKDRKRLLADTLALHAWDEAALAVGADRRAMTGAAQALDGRISALSERVAATATLQGQADDLARGLADADRALAEADERVAGCVTVAEQAIHQAEAWRIAQQALATAEQLAAAHRKRAVEAQVARERLDGERSEAIRLAALAVEHADKVADLADLEHQDAARTRAIEERDRLTVDHGRLIDAERRHVDARSRQDAKIETIKETPDAVCDRCEQHLGREARTVALASLRTERDTIEAALADARAQAIRAAAEIESVSVPAPVDGLDEARARLAEIHGAPSELAAADARITELERAAALLDDHGYREENDRLVDAEHEAHDRLELLTEPEPGALEHAQAALTSSRAAQDTARTAQANVSRELARISGLVDAARADLELLEQATGERVTVTGRLQDLTVLEQAFGRDGIPRWIVETHAIPAIEAEANRLLTQLGGPVTSVELRTERENKNGTVADALDIVCHTDNGAREYLTFSGGERTRIGLALRIGLSRLLAHRRDADVRLLVLDEPDGLDEAGMSALVEILRDLVQRDEVDTTILASHVPALRDSFDTALVVERADTGSTVVVA